jgi:hypothetical protein
MSKWSIRRRELLATMGAGAALLPLLSGRAAHGQAAPPKRLIICVFPNGYPEGQYTATGANGVVDLSRATFAASLAPLTPWKEQVTLVAPVGCPNVDDAEDYHRAYSMMFSGAAPVSKPLGPSSVWAPTGPTIDQVIASSIEALPRRTLPLALPLGEAEGVDGTLEARRAFWAGQGQPVTPEVDPYKLVQELFAGTAVDDPALARARAERRSMLDFLGRDLEQFSAQLGTEDKFTVASHLQGIRDLELQLQQLGGAGIPGEPPSIPAGLNPQALTDTPALWDAQRQILLAALRAGVTRVATMQFGPAWGDRLALPWLGLESRVWHEIGHGPTDNPQRVNDHETVVNWYSQQFAKLLEGLAAIPEPGPNSATMLDNCVVLWATNMLNGDHHPTLPWILAGKCGGYFRTGQYLASAEDKPVNHLFVDLAHAMDVPLEYLGNQDIRGPLSGLKA